MKKYILGVYKNIRYSLIEVEEFKDQVVLRIIGTKDHLTLHRLDIQRETSDVWIIKYQDSPLTLVKQSYAPISYNWNSSVIRGVWSEDKVNIAKKIFKHPNKDYSNHATSSQGLLVRFDNADGYYIGGIRINLNTSSSKQKYLNLEKRLGEVVITETSFMVKIILSTLDNKYRGKSDFSFLTCLGELFIEIR